MCPAIWLVELSVGELTVSVEVPSHLGSTAAVRRAFWFAVAAYEVDIEEIAVREVTLLV
jgi:hypothetical protein